MTKTELLSKYTAEQLADMVVEREKKISDSNRNFYDVSVQLKEVMDANLFNINRFERQVDEFQDREEKLQSEVEKYRKAFEEAKKERDCQIAEYQNKTEKDKSELERARNTINQIDDILEKLFGVRHDTVGNPDEFEKILDDKIKGNVAVFLPAEPIKVADMLINAKIEPVEISENGMRMVHKKRTFCIPELRQIAEHLLVYCNHNWDVEE